jgi:integrase
VPHVRSAHLVAEGADLVGVALAEDGQVRLRQALAVQKIDYQWQFVEPKSANGRRIVPLCQPAIDVLCQQQEQVRAMRQHADMAWQEWGLVFPSVVGTPLDSSNVTHHLQRRLDAAGLPRVTFHALRHTCGSLLHQEGVPARTSMEVLGHSQITLTLGTYCHATNAMFDEAVTALEHALGGWAEVPRGAPPRARGWEGGSGDGVGRQPAAGAAERGGEGAVD